jgi:hypothetical protein
MTSKIRCAEMIMPRDAWSFKRHQCDNTGKVERNGQWYCGLHDPEKTAAKQKAQKDKWETEYWLKTINGKLEAIRMDLFLRVMHSKDPNYADIVEKAAPLLLEKHGLKEKV